MCDFVVLVDEKDQKKGLMEKIKAHKNGILHRAFSVFIFNTRGEILLQKRAKNKYHSPLLWTNAVCSHPKDGESYKEGAVRRLKEELGVSVPIDEKFHFIYKAYVGKGLWEHELDYVFAGIYEGGFLLNPGEVAEVRYISVEALSNEMREKPENFTAWFKIILREYKEYL
ncbi:MAG: isopentenyl-diphosphate Delta-isomerase [Bergeyella sp.]|nr:isopentenyl-diphosphate Delta-isomerase [Bergeyella sp.]